MKAIILAAGFALPIMMCAPISRTPVAADEAKKAEPEFRLLVLDGSLVRWTRPAGQSPATVTYAFLTQSTKFENTRNCGKMLPPDAALKSSNVESSVFRREVRAAFDMWEAAANITFRETADIDKAGILIGAEAEPRGRAFTNVAPHGAANRGISAIAQSLICLNPTTRWKVGFDGDLDVYDLRYTVAHEIGHAIGLDHPSAEGQLMSYRYVEHERALRPGDVAGAVALYGAPPQGATSVASAGGKSSPSHAVRHGGRQAAAPTAGGAYFGLGESEKPLEAPRP